MRFWSWVRVLTDIDAVGDDLDRKPTALEPGILKVLCPVVEYKVLGLTSVRKIHHRKYKRSTHHSRQLLQPLQQTPRQQPFPDRPLKTIRISRLAQTHLIRMIRLDLAQLRDEPRVVRRQTTDFGQGEGGFLVFVLLDQEARGLGEEDQADADDDGPGELDGNGDAVGPGVVAVACAVVDYGGEEEALDGNVSHSVVKDSVQDVRLTIVMAH